MFCFDVHRCTSYENTQLDLDVSIGRGVLWFAVGLTRQLGVL